MKLSLIIATYNRASSLLRTLESVARQRADYSLWECIVVNNNSTDSTTTVFDDFAAKHRQMSLKIVNETKQGLSNARNCGIRIAQGDIIAIIDDDETIAPDYISAYIDLFDSIPEAYVAGGGVVPCYETTRPEWMSKYTERMIANPIDLGKHIRIFPMNVVPAGGNMAFRREIFIEFGVFNPALGRNGEMLTGGEETELFARIRAGGKRPFYVPGAIIYHHIPDSKLTRERLDKQSFDVGRSKYLRAAVIGKEKALLADECLKQIITYLLASFFTITFRYKKAIYLIAMRRGIGAGIFAQYKDSRQR